MQIVPYPKKWLNKLNIHYKQNLTSISQWRELVLWAVDWSAVRWQQWSCSQFARYESLEHSPQELFLKAWEPDSDMAAAYITPLLRWVEARPINRPIGPFKGSIGHTFDCRHSATEVSFQLFLFVIQQPIFRLWDNLHYIPDVLNIQNEILFAKITLYLTEK